jgi:hypothetical protein
MTLALATAWRPRGESARFEKLLPSLWEVFNGIAVSLPPDIERTQMEALRSISGVQFVVTPHWSWGRYSALETALEAPASHILYADFDRMLRWVETRLEEWRSVLQSAQNCDCLIIGRTEAAYQTHPRALIETEAISNLVVSRLLGFPVDASAGAKGFSREAAKFLMANCTPGHALGTDAEWPIILKRAGYTIETILVDGLDWESADQYQVQAADPEMQVVAARDFDADPLNWSRRVDVALEIVRAGFEAQERTIEPASDRICYDQFLVKLKI